MKWGEFKGESHDEKQTRMSILWWVISNGILMSAIALIGRGTLSPQGIDRPADHPTVLRLRRRLCPR